MFRRSNPKNTTPKSVSKEVLELCAMIDATQSPIYVDVPFADGKLEDCFPNVQARVAKDGGMIQYGWMIWEHPGVLVEGVFHAIWRKPSGDLLDITPTRDRESRILFLPDSKRTWQRELVDNIRLPLNDLPKTRFAIKLSQAMFALQKAYYADGRSMVPKSELQLVLARFGLCPGHKAQLGLYEDCPCGSGNRFKFCCINETKRP